MDNNDTSGNAVNHNIINMDILDSSNHVLNDTTNQIINNIPNTPTTSSLSTTSTSTSTYKNQKEFIIFKHELESLINNNLYILKECKANKRLLDIKYASLTQKVNYIQISVIVLSTLSGFLQSTKEYFSTPDSSVAVCGISISAYISLIL